MSLVTGARLGPYEVVALIGAGGMGEVYRARDPRLGRDVAIKVLPAGLTADPQRLVRFEQEARAAAALNHPNILAVYDVGQHDGAPFIVSELLDGETLRDRLGGGPLPIRKAVDYAVQVARGLAAAHDKGIVHRDLKPENVFVTTDGRVKILDFGLAKLTQEEPVAASATALPTTPAGTQAGVVLGTVGYMSPEQVRGVVADHRADIFALGLILYEMLGGQRAFSGPSAIEIMHAILKEEPRDLLQVNTAVPSSLDRVVRYCLEKIPGDRFQSARDLAIALETVAGSAASAPVVTTPRRARRRWLVAAAAIAVIALAASAGWQARTMLTSSGGTVSAAAPSFQRLTFRRGYIWAARFAQDGQSVVYSAAWEGGAPEVYLTQRQTPESRPLGLRGNLAGVSRTGELLVLLNPRSVGGPALQFGTLSQLPLTGGAPRELADQVWYADWSPDGRDLALVRRVGQRWRLEYPRGATVYETATRIHTPRISPAGDLVAFFESSPLFGANVSVDIVDRQGRRQRLSSGWVDWWNLAWAPDGREIFFAASESGRASSIYAVDLAGRQRLMWRAPGTFELHDVSRDGGLLVSRTNFRAKTAGLSPQASAEQDYSWHDFTFVNDLSADGSTLIFQESGEAGGKTGVVYLRKTDGSAAVRLGEGLAGGLSPDGRWVAAVNGARDIALLPTGTGQPRRLTVPSAEFIGRATWFPDGRRLLVAAREAGRDVRLYIQDVDGGQFQPIGTEGLDILPFGRPIAPDGSTVAVVNAEGTLSTIALANDEVRVVSGAEPGEVPAGWTADGRAIYVFRRDQLPAKVVRVELATGRRSLWKEIMPRDPTGAVGLNQLVVTPDGRSYFYSYTYVLSDLFLVEGVR